MKALDEIGYSTDPKGNWATAEVGGGDAARLRRISDQMDKIFASYGDAELDVLADFLGRCAEAGRKAANDLAAVPEVEHAEPNLMNRVETFYEPLDPLFPAQWHLSATAGVEIPARFSSQMRCPVTSS